jgi:hypothetical protein
VRKRIRNVRKGPRSSSKGLCHTRKGLPNQRLFPLQWFHYLLFQPTATPMKTLISTALLASSLVASVLPLAAQTSRASANYLAINTISRELAMAAETGTYCFVVPEDFSSAPETAPEQDLTALVQQVIATTQQHDSSALARFLAPEYRHYTPDNQVATRKDELDYIGSANNPFASATVVGPSTASTYGTTGVTVSKILFGVKNGSGKPIPQSIQMMMVWVQRGGNWQVVAIDSKMLPAPKTAKN